MTSLALPTAVVALANKRLRDADEGLSRKLDATRVEPTRGLSSTLARSRFGATERRVLGLVREAQKALGGADQADIAPSHPLAPGPSRYAVLGAAGFEIPGYTDLFSEGGPWRADVLRRGTPDPNLSKVVVPTTQLAVRTGEKAVAAAGADVGTAGRARAFSMGILGAVATGAVLGPVQRGALARRAPLEWSRHDPGAALRQADALAVSRLLGPDGASRWHSWWPELTANDDKLLTAYLDAITEAYDLDGNRPHGWPSFEEKFVAGPALSLDRLKLGYARLKADQAAATWSAFQWWWILSPMLAAPPLSMALARLLPQATRFTSPGSLTDRSFTEMLTLTTAICSIPPFAYSMYLWNQIPEHGEVFKNALALFLLRLGLVGAWIPTIGTAENDPIPALRWIVLALMLGEDVYAFARGFAARNDRQRGKSLVFYLQTIAGLSAVATTGLSALLKPLKGDDDVLSWVYWGVITAGLLFGAGIPLALKMASGRGYLSWFATDANFLGASALDAADPKAEPAGNALAFDDSTTWFDPAVNDPAKMRPNLTDLRYPSGARPLARIWWEGNGDLTINHDENTVTFRAGDTPTAVVIGPETRTQADLVTKLTGALTGVKAEVVDAAPAYDLPWPLMLSDPGDTQPDRAGHEAHKGDFKAVGKKKDDAYLLRHIPRSQLATPHSLHGQTASSVDAVRVVPNGALGDLDETALGTAADLALLLCLGAIPSLATVNPVDPDANVVPNAPTVPGPIGPVFNVFRQWNLDERRVNEWRMLVAGSAVSEKNGAASARDPAMRPDPANRPYNNAAGAAGETVANAMGWVGLWRAWLRVAGDPTADADAPFAMPYTPRVRTADGAELVPTNAALTAGVRFVLDLP